MRMQFWLPRGDVVSGDARSLSLVGRIRSLRRLGVGWWVACLSDNWCSLTS